MNWQVFWIICVVLENITAVLLWRKFSQLSYSDILENRIIFVLAIIATVAVPFLWGLAL